MEKAPGPLTYEDTQKFLHELEEWWTPLGADVKAVEVLIKKLPARQPLSAEVRRKFRILVRKIERELSCPYPPHVRNICV